MKKAAAIVLVLAAAAPALAQDIENDDIPTQCVTVCANIATVSDDCDRAFDRDSDELQCMCQAENAREVVPLCAACIEFYDSDRDDNDNDDNDAGEIRRDCGFSSTTYDPSTTYPVRAMTAATSITSAASGNSSPSPTGTNSANTSASSRLSDLASSAATATGSAASSISSAISSVSSAAQPTNTGNTGATNNGAPAALAGAVLLAAAAWL